MGVRILPTEDVMSRHDRVIAELMDALNKIEGASWSDKPHALAYIRGVANQAQVICNAQREPNRHGYLVVKGAK